MLITEWVNISMEIKSTESPFFKEEDGIMISKNSNVATLTSNVVNRDDFDEVKDDINKIKEKIFEVKNPTQFIFINKSLNMNPGKVAAQAAHAQEEITWKILNSKNEERVNNYKKFLGTNPRTIIVLGVKDTEELYKVNSYLESCNILTGIYVDEKGDNYLLEPTAFATEYLDKTDERVKLIFNNFNLYTYEEKNKKVLSDIKDIWWDHRDNIFNTKLLNHLSSYYTAKTGKNIGSLIDD